MSARSAIRSAIRSATALVIAACLIAACAGEPPRQPVSKSPAVQPTAERFVRTSTRRVEPSPVSTKEQRCLALNLYWEARGEGRKGMYAVGWTVLNRVASSQFPSSVCGVIYQGGETPPCQFSWWCDGRSDRPLERRSWETALSVSTKLLQNPPPDPTGGALFYHNTSIRSPWLRTRQRTAQIGQHVFYR